MWRKISIRESGAARIASLRCAVAMIGFGVLWIAAVGLDARGESSDWIVLNNCRLIANPANDGDSFHVSVGAKEYIFRLYLVDAPETDEMVPRRLIDQAKYFGVTVPQAIEVGRAATVFTREKLSEPFTVFTHMSDAMGQSRIERFYAFVRTKDGDLGEQLVRNGLARIYGFKAVPPGLNNLRVELKKLRQLENQARQEKIGAWDIHAGRSPEPDSSPAIAFSSPGASKPPGDTLTSNRSHPKEKTALGRIDINTATEKELTTVPRIGHVVAARIIAARPFKSADDLKRVSGIGDKKYEQSRPYFQ
jgi:DNA uptake protein ComE-like DNA-binding protein